MQRPIQITFRGMGPSDAIESRIRLKATQLERFYEHITGCHVTVEAPHHHSRKGNLYLVRIEIRVPDGELLVNREQHDRQEYEDVHVAIRDAFDAAVRQLDEYVERRRRQIKRHDVPEHGKVIRLFPEEGWGIVELPDGLEVRFNATSVVGPPGFEGLALGDELRVVLAPDPLRDEPRASSVTPIGKHHLVGKAG